MLQGKDRVAKFQQKLDELEAEDRSADDPEYYDTEEALHFWTCVVALASPAPEPRESEECR